MNTDLNKEHRIPMWGRTDYHCEYCGCPMELWKPMETYKSDRCCELYSDFGDAIDQLEERKIPYRYKDVLTKCLKFKNEYPDIEEFEVSLSEMIGAGIDIGIISKLYVQEPKFKVIK